MDGNHTPLFEACYRMKDCKITGEVLDSNDRACDLLDQQTSILAQEDDLVLGKNFYSIEVLHFCAGNELLFGDFVLNQIFFDQTHFLLFLLRPFLCNSNRFSRKRLLVSNTVEFDQLRHQLQSLS
jgi:hypothetical protein